MANQIEQALEGLQKMKEGDRVKAGDILMRYARGEINQEEACYMLIDEELVPMPSRCGMYAKIESDEGDMKRKIREIIG